MTFKDHQVQPPCNEQGHYCSIRHSEPSLSSLTWNVSRDEGSIHISEQPVPMLCNPIVKYLFIISTTPPVVWNHFPFSYQSRPCSRVYLLLSYSLSTNLSLLTEGQLSKRHITDIYHHCKYQVKKTDIVVRQKNNYLVSLLFWNEIHKRIECTCRRFLCLRFQRTLRHQHCEAVRYSKLVYFNSMEIQGKITWIISHKLLHLQLG